MKYPLSMCSFPMTPKCHIYMASCFAFLKTHNVCNLCSTFNPYIIKKVLQFIQRNREALVQFRMRHKNLILRAQSYFWSWRHGKGLLTSIPLPHIEPPAALMGLFRAGRKPRRSVLGSEAGEGGNDPATASATIPEPNLPPRII